MQDDQKLIVHTKNFFVHNAGFGKHARNFFHDDLVSVVDGGDAGRAGRKAILHDFFFRILHQEKSVDDFFFRVLHQE